MAVQESESKPKPIVGGISPPYSADKGRLHLSQLARGFLQLQHPLAYGSGFSLLLHIQIPSALQVPMWVS